MRTKSITKWLRLAAAGMAVITTVSFSGCTPATGEAGTTESADAAGTEKKDGDGKDLTELNVVLDWYPNAIHTFLYEAEDRGYFEEEGIKVNLIPPAQSVDAVTFVSSGKAEIGLTYPVDTIMAVASGDAKIHALGSVTQSTLTCMASLKETGIRDLKDLKGKKIGYDGTASTEAYVRTVAGKAGLDEKDYEMVNVGFDLTTALTTKSVDIIAGLMINDEVITMENNGYDLNLIEYEKNGVPEMYDIVMVAQDKAYEENPELYKGFLRACKKGFADMKASEDEALDVIMKEMDSEENPLDRKQQQGSYETLLPYMETEDEPFLSMTDKKWQDFIDWMKDNKLLKKEVKPADVMIAPELD